LTPHTTASDVRQRPVADNMLLGASMVSPSRACADEDNPMPYSHRAGLHRLDSCFWYPETRRRAFPFSRRRTRLLRTVPLARLFSPPNDRESEPPLRSDGGHIDRIAVTRLASITRLGLPVARPASCREGILAHHGFARSADVPLGRCGLRSRVTNRACPSLASLRWSNNYEAGVLASIRRRPWESHIPRGL